MTVMETIGMKMIQPKKKTKIKRKSLLKTLYVLPTLANYATVGLDWTDAYQAKVLAGCKIHSTNRPSVKIISEAQALHDTFQQALKMLSLAGKVSYPTLKTALFLGPNQPALTSYYTYQTYSKKNTKDTPSNHIGSLNATCKFY
ncbi:uncharacterized protein MELLADRAFT_109799 [Melampsora larici-populina 98AG31]|uniref:Uncharacterized protein n=1 Tax=Melampsora larici-populina (strain 98AG31 / pathotype 3-4-7) TaxID=747676 RepID=F4RXN9_MELLP|nr:uncharacterized protein MELLADRAFT_109799 [Melampsora larici-populina 98AG31]EGG02864.1 hypothetical protein MELLADRAFT_109799 [Melampsora larici-populina 98AG31]